MSFYKTKDESLVFTSTTQFEVAIDYAGRPHVLHRFGNAGKDAFVLLHECDPGKFVSSSSNVLAHFDDLKLIFRDTAGQADTLEIPHKEVGHISAMRRRDGSLLLVIGYYIYRLENNKLVECGKLPVLINHVMEDKSGTVWTASYNGVIRLVEKQHGFVPDPMLNGSFVSGIGEDIEHTIWVTTVNNGVYSFSNSPVRVFAFDNLPPQGPLSLTSSRDEVYASFWNGYILKMNSTAMELFHKFPDDQYISNVKYDLRHHRLFVAKYNSGYFEKGVFYSTMGNKPFALKGPFLPVANGEMVNPTVNGLYWIGPNGVSKDMPLNFRANELCYGPDSIVLLAASDGLYKLDLLTGEATVYAPSLKGKRVNAVAYSKPYLTVAVRGEGIWIRSEGEWVNLSSTQGLCSDFMNRVIIDQDECWCSSTNGISRIALNRSGDTRFHIVNYTSNVGLKENEINDILLFRDTVWVASKNAICFFPRTFDPVLKIAPNVLLTGIKVNNKPVSVNGMLDLYPDENNISVSFSGISPSSRGKMLYRYLLISYKDTFESFTTNRQVDFAALDDGKYTFQVYARNVHGVWSAQPVTFSFVVNPPVWKRWWLITIVALLLALVIYLLMRYRVQKVREEQAWKSGLERQLLEYESKALRAQMNPHFIFNVMNSIQDYILKNDMKSAQKYLTKFARLVRMILDNSVQSDVLLDEELKANRLYVELEQQRFNQKFVFDFQMDHELEEAGIRIPSMLIQPFLENAIKHGIGHLEGEGRLRLSVFRDADDLIVEIEDNGVGRTAAAEWNALHQKDHQSMGSLLTEKRVEILNDALHAGIELEVTDLFNEEGKPSGTRVVLVFTDVAHS